MRAAAVPAASRPARRRRRERGLSTDSPSAGTTGRHPTSGLGRDGLGWRPVGLCGSALIDVVAGLLRHGVVMGQGLILANDNLPEAVPDYVSERIVATDDGPAFMLARAEESGIDGPVLLVQNDVRELQLAVAAIRAGIAVLTQRAGVPITDIQQVLIAGGFGNFIRRSNAQRIGLLPPEIERRRISFVGNASLAGARLAAVSQKVRSRADEVARQIEHVDLSTDPAFQTEYVQGMFFPE